MKKVLLLSKEEIVLPTTHQNYLLLDTIAASYEKGGPATTTLTVYLYHYLNEKDFLAGNEKKLFKSPGTTFTLSTYEYVVSGFVKLKETISLPKYISKIGLFLDDELEYSQPSKVSLNYIMQ